MLPNFGLFNLRAEAVHGIAVPAGEVLGAVAYGVGYTAAVLAVAMWVFDRRDFK